MKKDSFVNEKMDIDKFFLTDDFAWTSITSNESQNILQSTEENIKDKKTLTGTATGGVITNNGHNIRQAENEKVEEREGLGGVQRTLLEGKGICCNYFRTNSSKFAFKIYVYREGSNIRGRIEIRFECGRCYIRSSDLESYAVSCRRNAVAVFDYEDPITGACKALTVYVKEAYNDNSAKLFIYAPPLDRNEIRIGGNVENGYIDIKH